MKQEIIASIKEKELQLSKLKAHIDKSEVCSDLYNKVLIQKAELKKQLQDLTQNKFLKRLKNIIPQKREKLICDYFSN